MILAVTGHRPQKFEGYASAWKCKPQEAVARVEADVRRITTWALKSLGVKSLISGMALGVDQWVASECVNMGVPFFAAVPCDEQDKFWSPSARAEYKELLAKAAGIRVVTPGPYVKHCMQTRNQFMIDSCASVLAFFDGTSGGTANAVTYAIQQRRPVLRYNPFNGKSEWLK